jgi:hypothetical protein
MGYDDLSVFMNTAGGWIYYILGCQHTKFAEEENLVAVQPGGGPIPNHTLPSTSTTRY